MFFLPKHLFLIVGDDNGNENYPLAAMHILFLREHNYQAREFYKNNNDLSDEEIFQKTRKLIIALFQKIVYYEFLPNLFNENNDKENILEEYRFDPTIELKAMDIFSHAAFRLHSMVTERLHLANPLNGQSFTADISLKNTFYNTEIIREYGIDALILGLIQQKSDLVGFEMSDSLRNFLFYKTEKPLDLFTIDIVRGRELGLPHYLKTLQLIRKKFNLCINNSDKKMENNDCDNSFVFTSWKNVTKDSIMQKKLSEIYGAEGYKNMDLLVGLLAEQKDNKQDTFGPTQTFIIKEQFKRLRNGDKFYFEYPNLFEKRELEYIFKRTLRDIILDNTNIDKEQLAQNVFSF